MDKTVYILEDRKIRVEWTILKGTSPVREDFRRALVKVFLIGNCEKYLLEATADRGTLMIDIPEGLEPGLYSLEAIWVKNAGHPGRHDRDLCRSMKQDLFAITEFEEEATNLPEGTVVLKAKSSTATYGYDGLSSYELAVLRGEWNGTEGEWLKHQRYVSVLDGRGDSEVDTMSQKSITEELVKHDTAIEDTNKEIDTAQTDIKNLNDEMDKVQDRLNYIPKESFLSSEPACDYHTEDNQDELTVSRAIKDRFGRIIDEHYVTRETVKDYTQEVVDGSKLEIQPGSVKPEDLSPVVQQMIESAAAKPGHITNLPDEEDLTVTEHNTLQFKDREYNPYNYSGMGKVYLRKHIVNGTNILAQHMMTKPNTIYVIRYDYCLAGETIEVPEGCVLEFDGGTVRNGKLIGNETLINANAVKIFDDTVSVDGKWNTSQIYPEWFGAIADNKTDSCKAIQKSFDFANQNNGSTIKFSSNNKYVLNSLSDNDNKFALVLNEYKSINIEGVSKNSAEFTIICNVECEAALVLKGDCRYFSLSNISIDGNYKCNYVILCKDSYSPYLNWDNVSLYHSNNIVCKLATYVSTFNSCSFTYGRIGLAIDASEFSAGPNTSITLTSCYANWCDENGYYIRFATYCSMVSCACDHAKIAYKILNPYGFSMLGCGAEDCRKLIECSAVRVFSLDTFYALNCGGKDENNITEYLIEFTSAVWTKINGFYPNNCSNFKYKLGLTGNSYGSENISILDASISREESYQLSNYSYTYPIKFFRNDLPNRTYTATNQEELDSLIEKLRFSKLTAINRYRAYTYEEIYNTTHIISLSPGIYKIASLSFISGGDIVIKSSTGNPEDVTIHNDDSFNKSIMIWQVNRITFDSITFTSLSVGTYITLIGSVSSFVTFNNCVFSTSGSNKGLIAMARLNSTIVFKSNCSYSGNFHQIAPIDSIVGHDDSSRIVLDRVNSFEDVTSNFRYPGCKIYFDNPINSGIIGVRYGVTESGGFGTATVMTDSDVVGSTDELNNITIKHRGLSAYNTTFNKPVWWTGSKWVDATGAEV